MRHYTLRILAISDIHGHVQALSSLLQAAKYDATHDNLYLCGDYIDKGPDSTLVLELVMELVKNGAKAILGNHEHNYLREKRKIFSTEIDTFIKQLPLYIMTDQFLFVHAGIHPQRGMTEQCQEDLLTIREPFFSEQHPLPQTVVFGHTPTFKFGKNYGELWHHERKLGIDTGAGFHQYLSLVDLTNKIQYRYCIKTNKIEQIHFRMKQ